LKKSEIEEILLSTSVTQKDKVLLILSIESKPLSTNQIREIAIAKGVRDAKKWNISDSLLKLNNYVIKSKEGWEISLKGREHFSKKKKQTPRINQAEKGLRSNLKSIKNKRTIDFVSESITNLETKSLRSAVVLSWIGAMSILYEHTFTKYLALFNTELVRRSPKHKIVTTLEDFSEIKEYDFLQILGAISVLSKNVKQELENCLKLRNGCGHPNSLLIGEERVAAHIEILILNVYSKF